MLEAGNSPLERGGCAAAGVCRILHKTRSTMQYFWQFLLIFPVKIDNLSIIRIPVFFYKYLSTIGLYDRILFLA
jgi:hypothetical protein